MAVEKDDGCFRLIEYYNRRRKRACKSKPVLKKDNTTNDFRFSDYSDCCRRRKSACKSKGVVSRPGEDDVTLLYVLKKRKLESSRHAVLQDSALDSRVFAFRSASGYSEKQGIQETLARICSSAAALRGCGRLDNYEKLGGIGHGSYGAVYRARDRRSGEIVAMKDQLDGMSVPTLREIDIMRSIGRHPGIVGFKEVVSDDSDGVYIIMEYADYDLHRYMEDADGYLTLSDVKEMMVQLVEAVKFLHDNGVMHRDLKPSNILVKDVDGEGVLKICDFGQSRRIDTTAGLYAPHVGTGWYRAPELLREEEAYSEAVDMWAVGCVMAEMMLRCGGDWEAGRLEEICRIVGDESEGYERLRSEVFPAEVVSGDGFDLLKRFLCCDPSKRITAEDALSHIWFQEE